MKISSDKQLNPELAAEVQGVRGLFVSAAEKSPLPDRFFVKPHPDRPAVIIRDTETDKEFIVSLCHYQGVRQFITEMFGE